jgi:hypothetical protein
LVYLKIIMIKKYYMKILIVKYIKIITDKLYLMK